MFFAHVLNIKDRGLTLDLLVTPKWDILANSEDPDEMLHFISVITISQDKKDLPRKLYSETCLKRPLENRQNKGLNDKW